MNEPLILTMDFGTQSVRVALFDKRGYMVAMKKKDYDQPYFSVKPNWAEKDPREYYKDLCLCTKELIKENPSSVGKIKGITLTCFRDTAVLLDSDMKVIRPSVLWLDQRNAKCEKPLPKLAQFLFKLVGKTDTINFNRRRCVANWIQENEKENWAKVYKYVPVSSYIHFLLTGELKDCASNCAGHYPIDFKNKQWYKKPEKHLTGQIFGLTRDLLPELVGEGDVIGKITKKAAEDSGIPEGTIVYAAGSDKSCETLGMGVIDETLGALSYGTASSIETTTAKYHESEPFLPGYPAAAKGFYNMDIQVYRGYWMINWFMKEIAGKENPDDPKTINYYNEHLNDVPAGCDGLILQPYWGPGLSRPLAKGAIIGFSDSTTTEHIYRSIIEGIAYALREGLEHFEKVLKHKIPELRVSGGGSVSDEICQITADVFGKPVSRVQTKESSSLGAAIAGFMSIGEYKTVDEAVKKMVRIKDTFQPKKENVKVYDYLYKEVYLKLYPALAKNYAKIKRFNNGDIK